MSPFGTFLLKKNWSSTQHIDADYPYKPKTTLGSDADEFVQKYEIKSSKINPYSMS